ncbi:hypothetical protein S40285_08562 [Stachybotrys chlorohalonatus IBT 40285]|uniref:CFEM domain-containing protein n=1 Tax=Stachybotrys chlorohalonatus (strain IBT 40285) TaxID=1283841 RepID=A0A084QZJ9_STAC4|nr:hypothetical protein S40285_08562 [Stachybotrys chlorohalonata IBT 40285]
MHFRASVLTLALLGGFAASQTTTSSATTSSTSLPDLVAQIDSCVLGCLPEVAGDINCSPTDFSCICSTNPDTFVSRLTPCVLTSGCDIGAATDSAELVPAICSAVSASPDPEALASASGIVAEATGEPSSEGDDNDSRASRSAIGATGVLAALAAFLLT